MLCVYFSNICVVLKCFMLANRQLSVSDTNVEIMTVGCINHSTVWTVIYFKVLW